MKFKFRLFLALSLLFSLWTLSSPADLAAADHASAAVGSNDIPSSRPVELQASPSLADLAAVERMAQPPSSKVDTPTASLANSVYLPVVFIAPTQLEIADTSTVAWPNPERAAASLAEEERYVQADPRLVEFIGSVQDPGRQGQAVGLYAPGVMAIKIVQQPADNPVYVSTGAEVATQFRRAKKTGVLGLLAHNYLAGQYFFDLEAGMPLYVVRGDGSYQVYEVYAVEDYHALTITTFRALPTQEFFDQYALYDRVYRSESDRLVLQTCIEKGGNQSWGRRFVLARPVSGSN